MNHQSKVTASVVSHGQAELVKELLGDLDQACATPLDVVLTLNLEEKLSFDPESFRFPIQIIKNPSPKGFGANHNAAFQRAKAEYYCVLNPDIRIDQDPFPGLLERLADPSVGVVGPLILGPTGHPEDSVRKFPTPWSILRKAMTGSAGPEYDIKDATVDPDWVAGMFMVFRSAVFREMNGFDERYFLYYEDVDLCWRLRRSGYRVALAPSARVVHHARRESRRNLRYMAWHLASMLRFFRTSLRSR